MSTVHDSFSGENYIITLTCNPALKMFLNHFKLPQILKKQQSSVESIANMKVFACNALQVKRWLGQGALGDVYTTEYGTEGNVKTVVVKKMFHVFDQSEKKLFFKEAALLKDLLLPNIVKLLGVCHQPLAIMLEYVYIDFKLFWRRQFACKLPFLLKL